MAANVSPRVQDMLRTRSADTPVELHVMLRADVPSLQVQKIAERMQKVAACSGVEILMRTKMILCSTALGSVPKIAELPETFWIEINARAPVEELLDR